MFSEVAFSPFMVTLLAIFTILSIGAIISCEMQRRKAKDENKTRDLADFFGLRYIFAVSLFLIMLRYWIILLS